MAETTEKRDSTHSTGEEPSSLNTKNEGQTKITILLNATGNVPIMRKRKWIVDAEKTISWVQNFVHRYLKMDAQEKIFIYVNQTFAPSPDSIVNNLFKCHGTNDTLVLYYCKNQAWG